MLEHLDSLIAFIGVIFIASLLVTVLTQMVSSLFNLRGRSLLWGLTSLMVEIEPDLKDDAEKIAKKIMSHPFISSFKKGISFKGIFKRQNMSSIVRLEEFSKLLIQIAKPPDNKEFSEKTKKGLLALTGVDSEELNKQLMALSISLDDLAEKELRKVQQFLSDHFNRARSKLLELESWFDNMTDRVIERFTRNTKLITICGSIVVALVLQLDSIHLVQKIYANPEIRSNLVAKSDMFLEKGKDILNQKTIYDLSIESLVSEKEKYPTSGQSFANNESAKKWLADNLPEDYSLEEVLEEYGTIKDTVTKEKLFYLQDHVVELNTMLEEVGVQIFGKNYSWEFWNWGLQKILGIFISIALLSLGAPFWFNMLKNLTNLRTRLMQTEEKERQSRRNGVE